MNRVCLRNSLRVPGWLPSIVLLASFLVALPALSVDVVWRDMSTQQQEDWVIRWDIPGSIRHSKTRTSAPAQQRRGTQGAQQRRGVLAAQGRTGIQGAEERRTTQGAQDRRAGHASERTYQYVEERGYRPLGYYGSVRQDSR